jgi:small subunit ribosomal protein S10
MSICIPRRTCKMLRTGSRLLGHRCQALAPWHLRQTQSPISTSPVPQAQRIESTETQTSKNSEPRYPRAVQALHLKPLRREAEYGIPSCDLQIRSFSLQPLEFFSDFALRAAYYLGLAAYGPVPLPRITERWTVPRSHFIFKKSQENFERVTLRRLIQIKDGNPETVQLWLAYLRKHQYFGIGMKANVWEFSELGVGKTMEASGQPELPGSVSPWSHIGQTKSLETAEKVEELLSSRRFKQAADLRELRPSQ